MSSINIFRQHSSNFQPFPVTVKQGFIPDASRYSILNTNILPPNIGAANNKYLMEYSFTSWEHRRKQQAPEADLILPLIAAAGSVGMNRRQIGNAVQLDRQVLDELLTGMVQVGLLTVIWRDETPVYRAGLSGI